MLRHISLCLLAGVLVISENASAGRLLDYIRDYDLNDYALGVSLSLGETPYTGADNSAFAYPYLTSFRDSAFNRPSPWSAASHFAISSTVDSREPAAWGIVMLMYRAFW